MSDSEADDLKRLEAQAAGGDLGAQKSLALLHEIGLLGAESSLEAAAKWWREAAKAGDGWAQLSLGKILTNPDFIHGDEELAKKLFASARARGMAVDPKTGAVGTQVVASSADDLGKGRILLVDDSRTIRQMAGNWLREEGYSLLEGESGAEGIEHFRAHSSSIDVIVSDVVMPGVDGLKMVNTIRGMPGGESKPVIMLTSESTAEMVLRGKQLRVVGWLIKPPQREALLKTVATILAKTQPGAAKKAG